jgi:hypothetical protein
MAGGLPVKKWIATAIFDYPIQTYFSLGVATYFLRYKQKWQIYNYEFGQFEFERRKALGSFAVGSIPLFPTTKGQPPVTIGALGVGLQALKNMPHEKNQRDAEAALTWMHKAGDVGHKMGTSKNMEEFRTHAGKTNSADLKNPETQKGWAEFFEKDGKKYKNTDLQKWLNTAGVKDTPDAFIKRLKEGKVDAAEMERVYSAAGIPLASLGASTPSDAKTAAQEGKLTPEQNKLLDKKQRENMAKSGELTPDQVKQLEQIDKDLKDKDPKKVEDAKKQLAQISETVEKAIKEKLPIPLDKFFDKDELEKEIEYENKLLLKLWWD